MSDIAIRVDHPCTEPGRSMSKFYPAVAPRACPESSEGARHLGRAQQRHLGPGFLEAVYQAAPSTGSGQALEYELTLRGIPFEAQKHLTVTYKDRLAGEYIADIVVDDQIIPSAGSGRRLELKAISALTKAHEAQAHNYPSMNSGQASPPPACASLSCSTLRPRSGPASAPSRSNKSAW